MGDSEQPRHMSVNADTTISVNNQTQCNILGDGVGHSRFPLQPQHASYSEVTALPGRQSNAHTRFSDTSLTGEGGGAGGAVSPLYLYRKL